ncbi:MAG TPA: hypothetical protein VMI54_06880 [Polyangiaceae bacterium]|nr:hypothetical protein [Polyangiaceae bacterium]
MALRRLSDPAPSGSPKASPSGRQLRVPQPETPPSNAESRAAREDVLVRLMFTPGSSPLEATHAFLCAYTAERLSPLVGQRVCVAAHELLSNATSYATRGDIVLEIVQRVGRVSVRVTNSTIPARISMLTQQLEKIRESPEDAFNAELKRSLAGGVVRPMLGLARIAHEVGFALALDVQSERVVVSAHAR